MARWRSEAKSGKPVRASMIHTASIAGFAGNFGQAAYSAAKAGIVALSQVAALEGYAYGVRSDAVAPSARTRLDPSMAASPDGFDMFDPANVSPLVAWLAESGCPATGQILQAYGDRIKVLMMPTIVEDIRGDGRRWTPLEIDRALSPRLMEPHPLTYYVEEIGSSG
jgi:NAD(P)-dependent dehydrogenase (short-subunit alcohol dehydrogenase family)